MKEVRGNRGRPPALATGRRLWIAGKVTKHEASGYVWEFVGVFSTEAKAVAACRTADHSVAPCGLNQKIPEGSVTWPKAYYPKAPK